MDLNIYLIIFSVIAVLFLVILLSIGFERYNKKVLRKSYLDTKLYLYIIFYTIIFYIGIIVYSLKISSVNNLSFVIYALAFIIYSIVIMLMLLVTLLPLKKIKDDAYNLALGRKNLNFDFEGASEFEDIANSFVAVQKKYKENDKKLNKKDYIYQKYIPRQYLRYFSKKRIEELDIGECVQVRLCTIFCDLRNSFYSSETLGVVDNFNLIKNFMGMVTGIVQKNNGFVDKFLGDGVIAIFDKEDDALKSANEISNKLYYEDLVSIGKEPIKFGISLNSGICVVGVIGDDSQKQITVISDVVNLCSRMEQLNKLFGTRVLMTKQFVSGLKENYNYRYIGTIKFDDLVSGVPVFESLDSYLGAKKTLALKNIQEFESGVRLYEKKEYDKSKNFFLICIKSDKTDEVSHIYLNRILEFDNNVDNSIKQIEWLDKK